MADMFAKQHELQALRAQVKTLHVALISASFYSRKILEFALRRYPDRAILDMPKIRAEFFAEVDRRG